MGRISLLRNVARQQTRRPLVAFSTNFDQKQATFPLFGTLGAAAVTCLLIHKKEIAKAKEAEGGEKSEEKPEKPKKFKEKQMRSYENKIRMHSQPDKIFRYFATIASINDDSRGNDIYMTPEDLVRSLNPSADLQPDNLLLDQYRKIKTNQKALRMREKDLAKLEPTFRQIGGYINYEDYMFLLMMLTTPRRNFEIAFRMFDLDGNGVVDAQEFAQVTETIMRGTAVGKRHTSKKKMSNIATAFFGEDRSRTLTSAEMIKFQANFQRDLLRMEFNLMNPDPETGLISEKNFANMLLTHARFDHDKARKTRKRVNKMYKKKKVKTLNEETGEEEVSYIPGLIDEGVSFEQVENFFSFIKNIHDVEIAFTFFAMATHGKKGKEISEENLLEIARTVCGVELNERCIKIIFTIFDDDGNGMLTHKEFIDVMKRRLIRGLDSRREIGFVNKVSALGTCAFEAYAPQAVKQFVDEISEAANKPFKSSGDDFGEQN